MNIIQVTDESQIKEVISHYKNFYLSIGIILACILLIIFFISPLLQQYGDQQVQIQEVERRIAVIQKNINLISAVNEQDQSEQLQTAVKALPEDKDYAGILYAIRQASSKTNVSVGDFNFSVGELSSKNIVVTKAPFISMNLNISGVPQDISHFLTELSQSLPLSNVSEIHISNKAATLVVVFYYKPIPQLQVNYTQPFTSLSPGNIALLKTMKGWRASENLLDISVPIVSTGSATPFSR